MEHELLIEAGHTERNYWRDLFRYRELFYFLANSWLDRGRRTDGSDRRSAAGAISDDQSVDSR